jgi:hypothetical protein
MICPNCKKKMKCVETRSRVSSMVYRMYRCPSCDGRFSSREVLMDGQGIVSGREGVVSKPKAPEVETAQKPKPSSVAHPPVAQSVPWDEDDDDWEDGEVWG